MSKQVLSPWADKLSSIKMPVLPTVISQLNRLTGDDDADVHQLTKVILKEPNLTSQVLRLANSVQYNPSNNNIDTISRAVVFMGFRNIRSLCISLVVIDSLLGKEPRERLLQTMARSFHAAVQARAIFKQVNQKYHEEVFIAALLYRLGEMAFWAYGGQTADHLDQKVQHCLQNAKGLSRDNMIIEKELGVNFKRLSRELAKAWHLGDILQEALSNKDNVSDMATAVRLGEAISRLAKDDSAGRLELLRQVATFTQQAKEESAQLVDEATKSASDAAIEYGVSQVCSFMSTATSDKLEQQHAAQVLHIDRHLQVKVLRDLDNSIKEKAGVNTIFQMALEGMHRGIGLERVALAFFRQDCIKAKYVLGQDTDGWRDQFIFSVNEGARTIFADCLHKPQPVWLDEDYLDAHEQWYTDKILALIGKHSAFIGVLKVNRRNAVLFYADRGYTQQPLSGEQFDMFKRFLSRTEMTVQMMADST